MGEVQAENAWRPSALVGAAVLKWRCVLSLLRDLVITLSKSLGLVGQPFWVVEKIDYGESAAVSNLCSLFFTFWRLTTWWTFLRLVSFLVGM